MLSRNTASSPWLQAMQKWNRCASMCSQRMNWTRDLEEEEFRTQFSCWRVRCWMYARQQGLGVAQCQSTWQGWSRAWIARDPFTQILVFAIPGLFLFQAIELGIFHMNEPHSFALRAYVCEQFKHYANKADEYIYIWVISISSSNNEIFTIWYAFS